MTTKIKAGVIGDNVVGITQLNVSDGSDGQALVTNGSGTLSFASVGVSGISSSADATAITIDSSEKVGIGASPQRELSIQGVDGASGLTEGNSRTALFIDNAGATYINLASSTSAQGGLLFSDADANNRGALVYEHANDAMTFDTAGSERMRITSAGDVTITSTGSIKIPVGTTAQRPTAAEGMIRYNSTLDYVEYYNGTSWLATSQTGVEASGGTETTVGGYKIHTFTSSGNFTVTSGGPVEYLVIAGGGGGGSGTAGGGGAGGYRTNVSGATSGGGASAEGGFNVSPQTYSITVGAGGAGGAVSVSQPANGSNSVFSSITSLGGGAGGEGNPNNTYAAGQDGGSGGGDWQYSSASRGEGSGTTGQGYDGGTGASNGGSGGGGAGGQGVSGSNGSYGGNGGNGVSSSITGTAVVRGGGGAGAGYPDASSGGNGGGGGFWHANYTQAGTVNTGGGGAGGYSHASGNGGNGGSGIVIIKYLA